MAKKRILISLTSAHEEALEKMMTEDGHDNTSYFIGGLIGNEWKRREAEKAKRPVGRPRKEDEENEEEEDEEFDLEKEFADDLPKNINWYGVKIGERQLKYYEDLQKGFKAK